MGRVATLAYRVARLRWWLTRPLTLGVRLLLVRDGQVLLVEHTYRPQWYLAGGGVERGESLEEAARREAREEVGTTLGALRLFGVYSNFAEWKSDHVVVFVCQAFEVAGARNLEIERVRFFPLDALPEDLSAGSRRRLEEYRTGSAEVFFGSW